MTPSNNSIHRFTRTTDVPQLSNRLIRRERRLGRTLRSLFMLLCAGGCLGGAAMLLDPQSLLARPPVVAMQREANPIHAAFASSIAALISDSHEVLAVHERGLPASVRVVLWTNDRINPGQIDASEVAVLVHNRVFQTITMYTLADEALGPEKRSDFEGSGRAGHSGAGGSVGSVTSESAFSAMPVAGGKLRNFAVVYSTDATAGAGRLTRGEWLKRGLSRATVCDPVFCDRWQALTQVRADVIGSGISDMRIDRLGESEDDLSRLWLTLKWDADSVDGFGEAAALIDSAARRKTAVKE